MKKCFLIILSFFLILGACHKEDKLADLKQKMAEMKSKVEPESAKFVVPKHKKPQKINYKAHNFISPFVSSYKDKSLNNPQPFPKRQAESQR